MKVITYALPPLGANCHVVFDENTKRAIAIDIGGDYGYLKSKLASNGLQIVAALLTHGHFDHFGGAYEAQLEGIPVYIDQRDCLKLGGKGSLADHFGYETNFFIPDYTFTADCVLKIDDFEIKAIHTPGHTSGSCCFMIDGKLFSGDTLFFMSFGRTDLYDGNFSALKDSLKKLFELSGTTKVYPGHGENTTIAYEREFNPINDN